MTSVFSDPLVKQDYFSMINLPITAMKTNLPAQLLYGSVVQTCPGSGVTWIPVTDVYKTGDGYTVLVDLPGVRKEDIKISLENNRVIITGLRREPVATKEIMYRHRQIRYGKFKRCIRFPNAIDNEKTQSSFHSGVLEIAVSLIRQKAI